MESMGVASGCGCKEIYIDFLILLIPTPLVSALFSSIPTFCSFKKCFSLLFWYFLLFMCNNFFAQYKHTGVPWQPYEGLHIIMFYTRRGTHKRTLHNLQWTSPVFLQRAGYRS